MTEKFFAKCEYTTFIYAFFIHSSWGELSYYILKGRGTKGMKGGGTCLIIFYKKMRQV